MLLGTVLNIKKAKSVFLCYEHLTNVEVRLKKEERKRKGLA